MNILRRLPGPASLLIVTAVAFCLLSGPGLKPPRAADAATIDQTGPTTGSFMLSDIQQVLNQGYDPFGVVTTFGPDGSNFIAITGTLIGSADGYNQWVFFFAGSTFLGTDTSQPSPQLSLVGSPAGGQVSVSYVNYGPSDPLCCPSRAPITITYTWDGTRVTPNGTPPGH